MGEYENIMTNIAMWSQVTTRRCFVLFYFLFFYKALDLIQQFLTSSNNVNAIYC